MSGWSGVWTPPDNREDKYFTRGPRFTKDFLITAALSLCQRMTNLFTIKLLVASVFHVADFTGDILFVMHLNQGLKVAFWTKVNPSNTPG